jgi:hypothetical protein
VVFSVLFLHRDRLLSDLRRFSEAHADNRNNTIDSEDRVRNDDDATLLCIFEAAKNIGVILSAVENSQAPVITPYSGFSVFVAVHVNMYATIAPHKYPGGLKSAEDEKKKNLLYLERLTQFWPVGHQWVSFPLYLAAEKDIQKLTRSLYSGTLYRRQKNSMGLQREVNQLTQLQLVDPVIWLLQVL